MVNAYEALDSESLQWKYDKSPQSLEAMKHLERAQSETMTNFNCTRLMFSKGKKEVAEADLEEYWECCEPPDMLTSDQPVRSPTILKSRDSG